MGHTIIAFKDDIQIARLEFGATNYAKSSYLYKVLNADDCNKGVSGNGVSRIYTNEDIIKAKAALSYYAEEPFEMVRNIEKEQEAVIFLESFPGISVTDHKYFSLNDISDGILSIDEFLDTILKVASTNIEINFG